MSSLVAYEDSESEDGSLDQKEEGASASDQTGSCEQNQEVRVFNSSEVTQSPHSFTPDSDRSVLQYHGHVLERSSSSLHPHSKPQSCFDLERKYCSYRTAQEKHFRDTTPPLSLPVTQGKISPLQTLPHMPQSFGDGLNPAKRHHTVPSGVRPYIPKRQRIATSVETVDPKHPAEQVPGNQSRESQILSEVSARVKPYLANKHGAAGIPRRHLMSLGGHQGPVNTVQWCPVPHLSHLLLSASMDKTFKVWDGAESGRCLRVYTCHSGAVRDACWTPCGRHLLTGSFDNTAVITDVETGQQVVKLDNQFKVMCVTLHPCNPEVFLCGGYSSVVKAWDSRSCKAVKVYKAGVQQTLDILFLRDGVDFITSSDCVSRDSADRTLIAWDYETTAKVSNQIYHERYTCPSLALHPMEESFVAQTNGNYMAVFSSQRPYRMNKRRQYEGHKVEGYAVQCEFSMDGTILASGSSTGSAHFYDYHNARTLHTLHAHSQPCLCVSQHPILPATAATCDWAGEIKVWH
ncbi:WD repeat-containing protein 25 [Siniperca chuatsi]|uniref:WD repeat-containing protein 25 n=1 Tax=Siniperca chuatsi TaxID=119488 RepID=UPI001CE0E157|nr:WD repeat-containing protein 25 [Siniperca chuatsi]XP_044022977.1 WD repeat-containing protein 25 [Siniperca chuatsi]XP_044022978.1 WD repeat-containing protein 25 [Siniperca chuatsi]XP_044022979.1 WD repeat-containing protein 25 [Siniperca chuatsi]XP_044022980.1 WD repeat-containing protein 25 [Siniperca chuatsi]